ncbi:MAG: hypothetical protein LBM08_05030 [Dysgonamonadaceae bacterium]|jgi:hypothetical protein|nr:hypothetical protein [Dysgonamonadaceae bacterium]
MAKGSQNGISNNPSGRPKGSGNKIKYNVKDKIIANINDDFIKSVFDEINEVDKPEVKAKLKIELLKLFVPRPVSDEEKNAASLYTEHIKKLCGME